MELKQIYLVYLAEFGKVVFLTERTFPQPTGVVSDRVGVV